MATKDYKKLYEAKLEKLKKDVLGSEIYEELQVQGISSARLEGIRTAMQELTGVQPFDEYRFRTGKIFGILRSIRNNRAQQSELLELTGLKAEHIKFFNDYCGNLPYFKGGVIFDGSPMDVDKTKKFIKLVGSELGVFVEDEDVADITQERWDRLTVSEYEKAQKSKTLVVKAEETETTTYDE